VEARPRPIVEAAIAMLLPAAYRDQVLGDLWEQYTSDWQYVVDGLCTAPFVLFSHGRRSVMARGIQISALVRGSQARCRQWGIAVSRTGAAYTIAMLPAIAIRLTVAIGEGRWPPLELIALAVIPAIHMLMIARLYLGPLRGRQIE
jgi:hypothetical protein